jgi:hypothetical protein
MDVEERKKEPVIQHHHSGSVDKEAGFWQRLHREGIVIHEVPRIGQSHLLFTDPRGSCDYMRRRLKGVSMVEGNEKRYVLEFEGVGLRINALARFLETPEELECVDGTIESIPRIGQTPFAYLTADGISRRITAPVIGVELLTDDGMFMRIRFKDLPIQLNARLEKACEAMSLASPLRRPSSDIW